MAPPRRARNRPLAILAAGVLAWLICAPAPGATGAVRTGAAATRRDAPQHAAATFFGRASHRSRRAGRAIGVGLRDLVLDDRSRPTYDYATGRELPGRRLVTELRYPATVATAGARRGAPVALRRGGYPMIVFAEGYDARPDLYAPLLDAWVRAGYVVAAPEFPDTTYPAPNGPTAAGFPHGDPENDMVNEPADLSFVIGRLVALADRRTGTLSGLVDARAVLLAGQSDGGAVVAAYGYDRRFAGLLAPVRAVAVFEGYEFGWDARDYGQPAGAPLPLLVAQTTADTCNAPALSVALYDAVGGPKYFLTLEGGSHLGPYDGADRAAFGVVARTTLRFFQSALRPRRVRAAAVLAGGDLAGVSASVDTRSITPIPTPPGSPYCAPAY